MEVRPPNVGTSYTVQSNGLYIATAASQYPLRDLHKTYALLPIKAPIRTIVISTAAAMQHKRNWIT